MNRLTVCLLNWKRPESLARTLVSIAAQSVACTVFLWNNGSPISPQNVDWIVESSENKRCWPRWLMATCATTECVCSVDDDLCFADRNVLADVLDRLQDVSPSSILGADGVNLREGKSYRESDHLRLSDPDTDHDSPADLVKGKFMLMRTDSLRQSIRMGAPELLTEDDIALSAALAAGKRKHHLVLSSMRSRFLHFAEAHPLCELEGHYERRQAACEKYFAHR